MIFMEIGIAAICLACAIAVIVGNRRPPPQSVPNVRVWARIGAIDSSTTQLRISITNDSIDTFTITGVTISFPLEALLQDLSDREAGRSFSERTAATEYMWLPSRNRWPSTVTFDVTVHDEKPMGHRAISGSVIVLSASDNARIEIPFHADSFTRAAPRLYSASAD